MPTAVAVPDNATVKTDAVDVTESLPVCPPAVVGLNLIIKVTLLPEERVNGVVRLATANWPVVATWEIFTDEDPLLVSVSYW